MLSILQAIQGRHEYVLNACCVHAESMLRLACKIFDCDMACCTLLTGDAYHVLAGAGILRPGICPDRWGFCAWSFLNSNHELLVVEDVKKDVRWVSTSVVTLCMQYTECEILRRGACPYSTL